jgi:hypothetical protein
MGSMADRFYQFLVGNFDFLGFEFQHWMALSAGLLAIFAIALWNDNRK